MHNFTARKSPCGLSLRCFLCVRTSLLLILTGLTFSTLAIAEMLSANPSTDATIFSGGGVNGTGGLFVGTNGLGDQRRALLSFDLSAIPAGAVITDVSLTLTIENAQGPVTGSLHRLLKDWAEGDQGGTGQGGGMPSQPTGGNDVSWTLTGLGPSWTSAGGDFIAGASDTESIPFNGTVTFSGDGMESDLQAWVNEPSGNFGWIILGSPNNSQVRKLASRESGSGQPQLSVTYQTAIDTQDDIDVTGVTDISGDGVPDVAGLSQQMADRPRVRYYSGANRQRFDQVNYLSNAWAAVAAATVADGNQDGVRNDPAVAVLGRNIATNKLFVQVRMAEGGAAIAGFSVLSAAWTPVDVVVIDDANGDGVSNDTAIGVLGVNPAGSSRRHNLVQVRRLSTPTSVLNNVYFANAGWTPLAAGTVHRSGRSPLLAMLAEKAGTRQILVQARVLSDASLQRNSFFLNNAWRARDLAILTDTNGNSVFNDASYMVLAVNPGNGKNVVQIRRPGGTLVKNIFVLNENWQARRIARSDDISGNQFEELGVLANKISDGAALIQLKDFATATTTVNIFP
ncbi:MAG: DNRLRE domain-containing protein [Gammaproteobacteria bacterium]|nr:DNRLRE domain-containing protein [Gammaproteobacteria bacterium]